MYALFIFKKQSKKGLIDFFGSSGVKEDPASLKLGSTSFSASVQ